MKKYQIERLENDVRKMLRFVCRTNWKTGHLYDHGFDFGRSTRKWNVISYDLKTRAIKISGYNVPSPYIDSDAASKKLISADLDNRTIASGSKYRGGALEAIHEDLVKHVRHVAKFEMEKELITKWLEDKGLPVK